MAEIIKMDTPFTDYYDDGSIEEEGTYVNGKIDGEWRWFLKSGNIDRIGINKGDDWDGKFTKYYENGNIEQEIIWVGGCPEEITDYDEAWTLTFLLNKLQ